jgi:hypothetical protein
MIRRILYLFLAFGSLAFAEEPPTVKIGSTQEMVISIKGKPSSQVSGGSKAILKYDDAVYTLKDGLVTEIQYTQVKNQEDIDSAKSKSILASKVNKLMVDIERNEKIIKGLKDQLDNPVLKSRYDLAMIQNRQYKLELASVKKQLDALK